MINNHRLQMLYQKTNFTTHKICQLDGVFRCSKCKKNNTILNKVFQLCIFCGNPNNITIKRAYLSY